jgi:integrase
MKYKPVGTNAADAVAAQQRETKLLAARENAEAAGAKIIEESSRRYLRRSFEDYKRDRENQNALEAMEQARLVGDEFLLVSRKTFVDEVTKDDVYRFHKALRERGAAPRTISNKHARLKSMLLFAGVSKDVLPPAPSYEEALPTTYTSEEIEAILAAGDDYLRLVIQLGLKCGLREQELVYLEWSDIRWADSVLRVTGKPHWEFKVKDAEQREVPIPQDLLESLTERKKKTKNNKLILSTRKGTPNEKLLRALKRLAKRAKLNCNVCRGCNRKDRECHEWTLHKFRRTYATTLLRNGVDLRTVQHYMGHSDIESTMRYLRPASTKETQGRINAIRW